MHLGYAAGNCHYLLDGDLYLPQSWHDDVARRQAAGIPDDMVYRLKSDIALELYDRELGVRLGWLTVDECYGTQLDYLRALDRWGQNFTGSSPLHFKAFPQGIGGRFVAVSGHVQPPRTVDCGQHRSCCEGF